MDVGIRCYNKGLLCKYVQHDFCPGFLAFSECAFVVSVLLLLTPMLKQMKEHNDFILFLTHCFAIPRLLLPCPLIQPRPPSHT